MKKEVDVNARMKLTVFARLNFTLLLHQLYERKFRKSQIANKYLQMTFEEAKKLLESPHRKPRKLARYRDGIIAWLEE